VLLLVSKGSLKISAHQSLHKSCNRNPTIKINVIFSQELANPLVAPNVQFYPEESNGCDVFKLSQSEKWLKHLPKAFRPQMCTNNDQHFYIFEPLQTFTNLIVVPIFFYTDQTELVAKCYLPQIVYQNTELIQLFIPSDISFSDSNLHIIPTKQFRHDYSHINFGYNHFSSTVPTINLFETTQHIQPCTKVPLPNPWRIKANGKIIRHMPTTMYSDDTSGNVSKQFNKHISFYFTLSGLPPNLTNQEYNCHFLSTFNRAGVLEIANQIVKESKCVQVH
jgi:hypothetical protein